MSSGHSSRTGRAFALLIAPLILVGTALCGTAATRAPRTFGPAAARLRYEMPLSKVRGGDLPLQRISLEQAQSWAAQTMGSRNPRATAPPPPPTTPQYIDLTTTPRPPLVGTSTLCQEIQPAWSWDQQTIFFASNNVDTVANYGQSRPPASALFHIYQMTSDGSFIQQITGTGNNPNAADEPAGTQLYPALSHAQTKLAYAHRPNPASPFELYVLTFSVDPTVPPKREQLTGLVDPTGALGFNSNIVNVEHPSWDPGDNYLTFTARNKSVTGDVRNVYVVNLVSKVVYQVTHGTPANGVEAINPVFHPSAAVGRITFAANTGNPANGTAINLASGDLNYVPNPLKDLRGDGSADDVDHNLFTVPFTTAQMGPSAGAPVVQLTTDVADDIEPAYEQSVYPPGQGTGSFNNFLAWSSLGRTPNNGSGQNSYDIYFNNGSSESANAPIRLFTPDTNAGAVPLHQTDERYPTWSSALPPQNPIDRIAFSSNRQNNVNDLTKPLVGPAGDTDIWAAEVTDITPPTLFPISDYAADLKAQFPAQDFSFMDGEVLHIANAPLPQQGRRIGVPRDTMYFYAKLKDLQYGIDTVWIQIKDPDGPSTDARGTNHKLYGQDTINPNGTLATTNNVFAVRWTSPLPSPTHFQEQAFETDYEGVGASDYQYFSAPKRTDPATSGIWTQYASKDPGVDDSVRWSGNQNSIFTGVSNQPPVDANNNPRWLQMKDDGIFPDLVAGDGIYSSKWVTPDDASDFYVDLIAYDKAFNPRIPSQQGNWIIYDNIWGFSTQPFNSKNPVLLVDDNGAGQKWPRGLKGSFRTFPTFRLGTESDIMDRPDQFLPREAYTDANDGGRWHTAIPTPLGGTAPGTTVPAFHFLDGDSVPYDFINWARGSLRAYRGDLWRILAKGPITQDVLNDYVPTRDPQPADDRGVQPFIQRPVPRRAVVWSAPYTGDIFSGNGTILDQTTQNLLTDYKSKAGRLVVAGGDILWALTVDGTQTSPFITGVLGANYTGDLVRDDFSAVNGGTIARAITHDTASNPPAFDNLPGTPPYWHPDWQLSFLGFASFFSFADVNVRHHPNNAGNAEYTYNQDGTPFQTQDGVTAASGFEQITPNRVVAQDDFGNTNSKTVFMSGSLASLGRRYTSVGDQGPQTAGSPPPSRDPLDCMNVKARLSHAMFCWMFSADLVGQIKNLNGGAPISGAFITLTQGGRIVGTAFSKADGTYTVRGLPVGNWTIEVKVPGFATIKKDIGTGAHGLTQAQADVFLSPAAPGSISGKVTDQFSQPIPNTTVQAHLLTNGLYTGQVDFFAVTQADGTYVFPSLPTGDYDVTVAKLPTGFTNAIPAKQTVTVNVAQNTPNVNFTATGAGATLTVTVFNQLPDGTKGNPVSGVSVDVLDNSGATLSGTTDAQGKVTFNNVASGPATVTAFLMNFQEASKKVNIPQDSQVEILLASAAHPVNLYGLVKRAVDAQPLDAKDITPAVTLQLLRKASQQPLPGVSANVFAPPASTPVPNNYQFTNAQEGLYTLSFPGSARFNPAAVDVNIGSITNNQAPDLLLVGKDGTVKGKVVDNNGTPLAGATVQLISKKPVAGTVVLTLTTAADGTFASDPTKLITSDVYDLQVSKFGFTSNAVTNLLIAGDTDAGTITLVRTARGKVFGLVTRTTDGTALPGVNVDFYSTLGGTAPLQKVATTTTTAPFTASDAKPANYTIGDTNQAADLLPAGDYTVRVSGDPRFATFSTTLTVTVGQAKRLDIALTPLPGAITGFVKDPTGKAISGATVTVNGKSVTTDSTGKYITASVQPNQYTVTASAFAFITNSITVDVMGPTTAPDLILQPVPPSSVSGTVRSRADNSAIGGVLIEFLDNTGAVVASTTSNGTLSGSPLANFQLTVAPGTYTVRASKSGWVTGTLNNIKVNPNVALTNLSILLDAEHTFGKGLVLMSLPYDYPGMDAATVLGKDPSTFKSAWWNPTAGSYDIYPSGGAREFRLGKALFVRLTTPTPFANASSGVPAPAAPFVIDLPTGWNMIGAVRKVPISWVNVRVRTPDGVERTMQEAYANNIIQNGLWLYQDGYFQTNTLQPFQGYFVRALQPCSLVIPVDNSTASAGSDLLKRMVGAPSAAQVAAELRAAGLAPETYGAERPVIQASPAFPARKPGSNPWPVLGAFTRPDAWLPRVLRG